VSQHLTSDFAAGPTPPTHPNPDQHDRWRWHSELAIDPANDGVDGVLAVVVEWGVPRLIPW
jgi:hypothetical protein